VAAAAVRLRSHGIFGGKWGTPDVVGVVSCYKLFSHKCYLVVPRTAEPADVDRLDGPCLNHGIGLVLFNPEDAEEPGFEIRVRALKHEPDFYYLNENLKRLPDKAKREFLG
jgi:hypothetical protein